MSDLKISGIFAAAVFALAVPNLAGAESLREASDFGDDADGAEIYVQLDEDVADDVSDEGSEGDANDEGSSEVSDEKTDVAEDDDAGGADETEVAEVEDAWVTTTGDGEGPIFMEFASGNGPVQRDVKPVPIAPAAEISTPVLVAADGFDATLGINVHDKVAVAAKCAVLIESGETYQAFYKLYCD